MFPDNLLLWPRDTEIMCWTLQIPGYAVFEMTLSLNPAENGYSQVYFISAAGTEMCEE